MSRRRRATALGAVLVVVAAAASSLAAAAPAGAQQPRRAPPRVLARADLIAARSTALHGGLGVAVPLGTYLRAEATVAGGVDRLSGERRAGGRADLVARFTVDPFRQGRWAPYGGAGASALRRGGDWRGYLLAVLGVEGPARAGFLPALELGLGGGARIGLVARRASPNRR